MSKKEPKQQDNLMKMLKYIRYPIMPEKPKSGKWYRYYPEGYVDALGNPTYCDIKLGRSDRLLLFFSGGGLSWNEYTAARPAMLEDFDAADQFYTTNVDLSSDVVTQGGLFLKKKENPFSDWTMVNFIYDTGDCHVGTNDFPYTAKNGSGQTLFHHGYKNYRAMMEKVKQFTPSPSEIVVVGCSGGAVGSALLCDDIADYFSDCQNVTCLVDSAILLMDNWHEICKNVWKAPEHITEHIHSNNLVADAMAYLHNEHGSRVKVCFCCSVRDMGLSRMQNYMDGHGLTCSKESGDKFEKNLAKMCRQLKEDNPEIGLYIFNVATKDQRDMELTEHCIINNPIDSATRVDGRTAIEWLWDAVCGNVYCCGLELLK